MPVTTIADIVKQKKTKKQRPVDRRGLSDNERQSPKQRCASLLAPRSDRQNGAKQLKALLLSKVSWCVTKGGYDFTVFKIVVAFYNKNCS